MKPELMPNGNLAPTQDGRWKSTHDALKSKHPDDLTPDQWKALGHGDPILKAVRANCIGCAGGSPGEVRACGQTWCSMWPFRMGTNPFHRRSGPATGAAAKAQTGA